MSSPIPIQNENMEKNSETSLKTKKIRREDELTDNTKSKLIKCPDHRDKIHEKSAPSEF